MASKNTISIGVSNSKKKKKAIDLVKEENLKEVTMVSEQPTEIKSQMDGPLVFKPEETESKEEVTTEKNDSESIQKEMTGEINGGDRKCYLYFSIMKTSFSVNADLLQISLVDSEGRSFYGEFNDYDMKKVDTHIFESVLKHMVNPSTVVEGDHWTIHGSRKDIAIQLKYWIEDYIRDNRNIQFAGDFCTYDFVHLCELINGGGDLPVNFSPCCYDLNQDLAGSLYRKNDTEKSDEEFNKNWVPLRAALDIDRKLLVDQIGGFEETDSIALNRANMIRIIHQHIWNLK